ncbi:MAG TPA: o-succinylbenzoate--CoA ligase [Marmoricola sp.]|nr:o-succinylbenzoate--CoA ligase [Marmoricola sp.]
MTPGRRLLSDDPVDVGTAPDPVAAVLAAHADGRRIALRTSGSTGQSRSVVRTSASWTRSFPTVAALTGLGEGSRLHVPGPLSGTMNLFAAVLGRWVGAVPAGSIAEASHAHLTPTALRRVLDAGEPVTGVHLTVAGDRLTRRLHDRAVAAGATVSHYYGAAELSFVAWGPHEDELRPFPGVEVSVRDGEVWVRSPFLCEGYDGPPGALRRDPAGFATVGDRGTLTDRVLRVAGRGSEAITTGGATVLVADVEAALRAAVDGELVVVGVPHAELGQVVAAVVTDAADLDRGRREARALVATHRPRRWVHVPLLPLTAAGKVDRAALAASLAEPPVAAS